MKNNRFIFDTFKKTFSKVSTPSHEEIDTPDTKDDENETPEDEPMKHKAKRELITRQVEDTNLANKKDKSHYLNELEVENNWRWILEDNENYEYNIEKREDEKQ